MRSYDVVLVMRPSVSGAQKDKLVDTVKKWLGDGKVTKIDDWGKKALSYPIKKENEGNYVLLAVESESGLAQDLEKKILMEDAIIRHLVLRKE